MWEAEGSVIGSKHYDMLKHCQFDGTIFLAVQYLDKCFANNFKKPFEDFEIVKVAASCYYMA